MTDPGDIAMEEETDDHDEDHEEAVDDGEPPPITIQWWSEFERRPASMRKLFKMKKKKGKKTYQPVGNKIIDFTQEKSTNVLKVETVEDIDRVVNDFQTKFLFFKISVSYEKVKTKATFEYKKEWGDEFALLVNCKHEQIYDTLSKQIEEVKSMLQEGKKFCIEIEFGKSVRNWFSNRVDPDQNICTRSTSSADDGASIYLTNHTKPFFFCIEPACWLFCFPCCCFFGGSCYVIHRKCMIKCKDEKLDFKMLTVEWVKPMD